MSSIAIDPKRARRIVWLAAPIVVAMVTQTFINVVDTIFVGKLDPSQSIPGQAALGFSLPIFWAFGGSLAAIGVGAQVMTARRWGAGKPLEAGAILTNAGVVAITSSIVATAAAWFLIPTLLGFLTSNAAIVAAGISYAQLRVLGIVSMVLTTAYKGFFDGLGRTRVHMYAALVMNVSNVALNYVLIFGMGSIPAMGIEGAALASLISTFIGLFAIIGWGLKSKYRSFEVYRPSNLSLTTIWELTKLSVPSGLAQVFIMSGVLLFLKIIAAIDDQSSAEILGVLPYYGAAAYEPAQLATQTLHDARGLANGALVRDWAATLLDARPPLYTTAAKLIIDLLSLGFVTTIAFGTATATLVSQAMGRRDYQEAADYGWDSVKLGALLFGALGALVIVAPAPFLDLLSDDPRVIAAAIPGLRIMAGLEVFIAMALILTQALFGAGATRFVMVVEFILHGLCLAPLAYLFGVVLDLGFVGVWYSAIVYVVLLATIMAVKFRGGSWTSIEV